MFTDKQALIVAAIMLGLFFLGGIFNILNNYIVMAILVLLFLSLFVNLFMAYKSANADSNTEKEPDNIK